MRRYSNPYQNLSGGQWLKGNLHCHSTRSDGRRDPQGVIDDYASRGYDFLMLSDHDIVSMPEDYAKWNSRGMLLINGNEVSADGVHILHVDADRLVPPHKNRQQVINNIENSRGFAVVAHPNWTKSFDHCPIERLLEWSGYLGMEVFNGLIQSHAGSAYAADKWDLVLTSGKRAWGFANDDSHYGTNDTGLGRNVVYAYENSVKGILDAFRAGRFYASTGVSILDIKADADSITITTKDAHRIAAIMDNGKRFDVVDAPTMTVKLRPDSAYVRFECFGVGERMAWSQPFYALTKDYIRNWLVSDIQATPLAKASHQTPDNKALNWLPTAAVPEGRTGDGFVEVHDRLQNKSGVVYLSTNIPSSKPQTGQIFLGYDGPIKAWLNGTLLFHGPGAPPALPEKAALYANFNQGDNLLTIALDSNDNKSWGIAARAELDT
jgi:hypothetical protein